MAEEEIPATQVRPEDEEVPEPAAAAETEKSTPEDTPEEASMKKPATAAKTKAQPKNTAKAKAKTTPKASPMKVKPTTAPKASPMKVKPTIQKKPSSNISKGGAKGSKGGSGGKKGGSKGSKGGEDKDKEIPTTPKKADKKVETPEAPRKRPAAADAQAKAKGKAKAVKKPLFEKMPAEKETEKDDEKEEPEEEQDFEDDKELDDFDDSESKTTDRCKKQKFMQMLSSGQVPAHVANMWKESTTMKTGRLDRQRLIINSLFDRSAAGRLIMNTSKPLFTSEEKTFSEYSNTKRNKSLPKVLFCGKFNLSEDAFQQGLANNEFQEIVEDGVVKYTWSSNVESTAAGSRSETGAKASVAGKVGDGNKFFGKGLGNMAKGLGQQALQDVKMPMVSKGPPPIMDQQTPAAKELTPEQWNFAQGQLHPSMAAMDKLEKEGLKMVQLVGQDNKQDPLFVKLHLGCISICK